MGQTNARTRRWVEWSFAATLILAGIVNCNGDTAGANSGSGTCRELMAAYCKQAAKCSPVSLRRQYGNEQGCVERQSLACATLALPGVAWTTTKVQQCTAQIASAPSCYGSEAEVGACDDVPGTLTESTPCESTIQCTSQCAKTWTTLPDGGQKYPACGLCTSSDAGPTRGCGTAPSCAANQRCVQEQSMWKCVSMQPEGASCSATAPCESQFACRTSTTDAGAMGVCSKRAGKGVSCVSSDECDGVAGLQCIARVCSAPTFVAVGEPCDATRMCENGARCLGSSMGMANTCVAPAADGSPCDSSANLFCRSPASCLDGVCRLPGEAQCK